MLAFVITVIAFKICISYSRDHGDLGFLPFNIT